jgi:hypothetical protein
MARVNGCREVQETKFLDGFITELLFFLAKAREELDCLLKHRHLAFQISEHFLLRIHPAVVQNLSATLNPILNGGSSGVSDQGEGVVICKISGLSADSRSFFCFSSQTPGKSGISCSNTEISIRSDQHRIVKSRVDLGS